MFRRKKKKEKEQEPPPPPQEEEAQTQPDAATDFLPDEEVQQPTPEPEQEYEQPAAYEKHPEPEATQVEEQYEGEDAGVEGDMEALWLGGYDPAQFEDLPVSGEIKEMFEYITRFKPQIIELETLLTPFIPDYLPAVGDVDPFLKVPRPDAQPDGLGLSVLDEPAGKQSNPAVLQMQLRQHSRTVRQGPVKVSKLENAAHNPREIDAWIKSVEEIHQSNPPPAVTYSKAMPEVESLMQEWPAEFEEALQSTPLPPPDMDVDLKTYVRLLCAMFDVPVYNNLVESLHMLFNLYSEFKNSQFLATIEDEGGTGSGMNSER